jgi:hypothetical protein
MLRRALVLATAFVACAAVWSVRRHARAPGPDALIGLWMAEDIHVPADPMHMYYFHKGGKGLYRYGQVGHNNTNSFDWRVTDGDKLELLFRKTGERARTRFVIGQEGGRRTLELADDPRAATPTRYRYLPANLDAEGTGGALTLPVEENHFDGGGIADRIWMDLRRYATGGMGFVMYQLSDHPSQPGWKIGWHHRGDFDDWSTEQLIFRVEPGRPEPGALRLRFLLTGQEVTSPITITRDRDRRTLTLERDPRNFHARTRLLDAGPSF